MTPVQRPLSVVSDGLRLGGGICIPERPRGIVVLLHGIPSAAPPEPGDTGYPGLASAMAERGWAAAWVEMRGTGASAVGYFSIEGWVRDAYAAIDASRSVEGLDGLPLAVVGSSAGGVVAVEAAARGAPVDALALLAAPAAWLSFAAGPAAGVRRIVEEAGMDVAPDVQEDASAWAAEFESVTAERSIGLLGIPLLIVHGTDDDVVPVEHAHRLAERAPGADVRILEDGGHRLRRDPRAVELVLQWLERVLS